MIWDMTYVELIDIVKEANKNLNAVTNRLKKSNNNAMIELSKELYNKEYRDFILKENKI
jgi:hypothetical protein